MKLIFSLFIFITEMEKPNAQNYSGITIRAGKIRSHHYSELQLGLGLFDNLFFRAMAKNKNLNDLLLLHL